MSEGRIIVNKHFPSSSAITENSFTRRSRRVDGGFEKLREGEIIISNEPGDSGIFIMTHDNQVIRINSGKNVKLSSDYKESTETGAALEVVSGDTLDIATGKLSKQIKDVAENAMPNIGDGLKIEETGDTKVLSANFDNYTIIVDQNGKLKVDTSVIAPVDLKLKYATVETHLEPFTGLDDNQYPAGIYLVLGFGSEVGDVAYAYINIGEIKDFGERYLTEDEYDAMAEAGTLDPNVTYYTYQE